MSGDENGKTGMDVNLKIAGQEISIKNVRSINTIMTGCTFILVGFISWTLWNHGEDTKNATKEFVGVMKEQTVVTREQNCLLRFEQDKRQDNSDFCKRISR